SGAQANSCHCKLTSSCLALIPLAIAAGYSARSVYLLADSVETQVAGIQREFPLENDIQGRAARNLRFRPARQKNRGKPNSAADAGANSRASAAARNRTNAGPSDCSFCNGASILPFAARTGNLSFRIGCFAATGVCAARRGKQIHRVSVGKDQRFQP